ncbi:MAG: hypothetical protein NVS1B4_22920 [Gemmatimonadaceae bacterium]
MPSRIDQRHALPERATQVAGEHDGIRSRRPAVGDESRLRHKVARLFGEEMLAQAPVGECDQDNDEHTDNEKRPGEEALREFHEARGGAGRMR